MRQTAQGAQAFSPNAKSRASVSVHLGRGFCGIIRGAWVLTSPWPCARTFLASLALFYGHRLAHLLTEGKGFWRWVLRQEVWWARYPGCWLGWVGQHDASGEVVDVAVTIAGADDGLDPIVLALRKAVRHSIEKVVENLVIPVCEHVAEPPELPWAGPADLLPPRLEKSRGLGSIRGSVHGPESLHRLPRLLQIRVGREQPVPLADVLL